VGDRDPTVEVSERAIVVIALVALGAYLIWAFFDTWGPSLRTLT
jgi:hypothetical protein